ncbi:DUF4364 family protein [Thermoanaerobacterium thermosaccharolyticum]|uniref:DUF4364 domain-containing protein n=1 Tax=Thermoanaerobacterium thermosaccharolyticum TaxID=1517 RepID=A0A223I1Y4_THETR|nr:DUF4364 family protein [Thermoanaerobacterium thermosaccharolyticum]AST58657.1 uncharacterized protein Thert_02843 [Thermoanaerobacterium thermosaccharolyticum]KAA5806466.1 DUF4364 family protein [Thermoanaerobacterium thermosaccharolyticum]TCW41870.1 uncharacterized protein DUF4364 [Thermohydrogenium kirishiense]
MSYEIQELAENKLIILYILNRIDMPITGEQINRIISDNNLMNYFYLQQYLNELEESNFIKLKENKYVLSEFGLNALKLFFKHIQENIRKKIDEYIVINKEKFKQESQYVATYYKKSDNEFIANLQVIENDIVLIEINLNLVNAQQAKIVCDNWKQKSNDIYSYIIKALTPQK